MKKSESKVTLTQKPLPAASPKVTSSRDIYKNLSKKSKVPLNPSLLLR